MEQVPEPSCHSYLGNSLSEVHSVSFLKVGLIYEILLIPIHDIVLFPGETVPLRIHNRDVIREVCAMMNHIRNDSNHSDTLDSSSCAPTPCFSYLGIVGLFDSKIAPIGTAIEIKSSNLNGPLGATISNGTQQDTSPQEREEVVLTAKGRSRFKVISLRR